MEMVYSKFKGIGIIYIRKVLKLKQSEVANRIVQRYNLFL